MQYVRKFDVDSLHQSRFDYQVLADLETCLVVACRAPAGQAGPARHVHGCNQVYYVLDGEMTLELGDASHVAGRDSFVFISEGTPHNWNAGDKPELHLDILVPPPARGNALVQACAGNRAGTGFCLRAAPSRPALRDHARPRVRHGQDGVAGDGLGAHHCQFRPPVSGVTGHVLGHSPLRPALLRA